MDLTEKEKELILALRQQDSVSYQEQPVSSKNQTLYYDDTHLKRPFFRKTTYLIIGLLIWLLPLLLFGFFQGLVTSFFLFILFFGSMFIAVQLKLLPVHWIFPYFLVTCPHCRYNDPYYMMETTDNSHPGDDHFFEEKCPRCYNNLKVEYKYTGRYDYKWDRMS